MTADANEPLYLPPGTYKLASPIDLALLRVGGADLLRVDTDKKRAQKSEKPA